MNRPLRTPSQIIGAARQRLAMARHDAGIEFMHDSAIGMLNTLADLHLIDMDIWGAIRAEFNALAESRRARLEGRLQ